MPSLPGLTEGAIHGDEPRYTLHDLACYIGYCRDPFHLDESGFFIGGCNGVNPYLLQAVLASLPLLGWVLDLKSGVLWGGMGVLILMACTYLFFFLRLLVPERSYRLSFFLLLFLIGVAGAELLKQELGNPAFILPVSLCVLTPPDFFRNKRSSGLLAKKNLIRGFYLWILLAGHGALSEWGLKGLGVHFAAHPAGSFFFLGLAMVLLPEGIKK